MDHFFGAVKKFADIDALNGGRNRSEIRERRIAPADARESEEDVTEPVAFGDLLHFRSRIGDGDEALAGLGGAHDIVYPFEEILLEDVGFQSASGLAGHNEEGLGKVELAFEVADLRRIGGIENEHCGKAGDVSERHPENFGTEARAPIPSKRGVGEARRTYVFGELL